MRALAFLLRSLLYGWILGLVRLIEVLLRLCQRRHPRGSESGPRRDERASKAPCVPINRPEFVRPDPLIYDQYYLSKLGFAVTWDNPDIQLYRHGAPVASSYLEPDTTYDIVARVWNGALSAPVVQMPVHFSYLDFGIGTVNQPLGTVKLPVLGVRGGPNHPGFVSYPWKTPARAGHYCIQVVLDPADDSNKANNLGQENTNVGEAHSPALFDFTLRNNTPDEQHYRWEVDGYTPGDPLPCDELARGGRADVARHRPGAQPLPLGWTAVIDPVAPTLAPGNAIIVSATVTPPTGFAGRQQLNVNAFTNDGLAGGVTLTVIVS